MQKFLLGFLLLSGFSSFAQTDDLPSDFLANTFYQDRRQKLIEKLPPHSVAVFFSNPERNRSNDVDFEFHQDPDFYYLTGYKEPNSLLLLFKENQTGPNGSTYREIIFVRPRNIAREQWTGRRLGEQGVKDQLGLEFSFPNSGFKQYNID